MCVHTVNGYYTNCMGHSYEKFQHKHKLQHEKFPAYYYNIIMNDNQI